MSIQPRVLAGPVAIQLSIGMAPALGVGVVFGIGVALLITFTVSGGTRNVGTIMAFAEDQAHRRAEREARIPTIG
jgi:hypothetical protein